jgi:hypothetical protein
MGVGPKRSLCKRPAASSCIPGITCEKVSIVVFVEECPRISCTTFGRSPAASWKVAKVRLSLWKVRGGRPAFSSSGRKERLTRLSDFPFDYRFAREKPLTRAWASSFQRVLDEPRHFLSAAPREGHPGAAMPVIVDARYAAREVFTLHPALRATRSQAHLVLQDLGLRQAWLQRCAAA